ncbi:MAG: 3-oxoacyl-ACP reductase FabG [Gammaproteobacteria bacterium]
MLLKGKIALVTGASRGIGEAIAVNLAKQGATVVGTATSQQGADKISDNFSQKDLKGKGFVLDVSQQDSVEKLFQALSEDVGAPNILVNNAAINQDNLLLRMKDEEWSSVIDANLTGVYRLCKICLTPMFRQRWGRIINISSVVGATGNAGQVNYTAAKAGVIAFSKSLAQEMASRGITVNVVAPGFVDTDMTKELPEVYRKEILKKVPMKRLGKPEDIADAVLFLVSEHASYITGETIHVNGGMYMH